MTFLKTYKWLIVIALLAGAIVGCYAMGTHLISVGYDEAAGVYQGRIDKQKIEAAAVLATETKSKEAAEKALAEAKHNQELKDAENQTTVADLAAKLRTAARTNGRLRDPNATGCGASGGGTEGAAAGPASAGPSYGAEAGGLLSAELTELLQRLTREADEINNAYASCRADSLSVRVLQPH